MSSFSSASSSNFQLIIDALANYADQTGIDLSTNPFADTFQRSSSPESILELLHEREKAFKEYRDGNRKMINFLAPAVQVLHVFSGILGESMSVPLPPAKAIFVGIDVLLSVASNVSSSYDALLDLFECIGNFLQRLGVYTKITPTPEMTHIIVKIMVELLSVLALATKQIKQGRFKKFAKKLLGESDVESVLQRLDRLTQDEARMTVAQTLDVVHGLVNNMRVVMDDGKSSMDSIREALVTMHQTANEVNKMQRDQLQRDLQHWLSPPDPSTNQGFVSEARHAGSAAWFLQSSTLAEWKETSGSLLWIYGKPGSGKSTLLSAIIQDVEDMCEAGLATMAYYYFDFRDIEKQNRNGLLSSLLSQLCTDSDSFCDILSRFRSSRAGRARRPTYAALSNCFRDMLTLPGQGPIYLIVDALDECPNTTGTPSAREGVLQLVKEFVQWNLPNVHLCVASRPEIDIRIVLEPLSPFQISLHDEIGQKRDIIEYIRAVVRSDWNMRKWREEDQQLVIDTLSEKADGMFRWVVCQVDSLRRSFPASIRSALKDLPKSLDETYEHTLLGIDDKKREYAQRLFRCLAVSIRPLRIEEVAEILAFQLDPVTAPIFSADWRPIDAEEAVLSACSSLVSVVDLDGYRVVQFAHFSVKEFLLSDRLSTRQKPLSDYHIHPVAAHTILAHASLSVLLQLDNKINKDTIGHFPLASYAARYWVDHGQFEDVSLRIQDSMERLFDSAQPHFAAWVWLYDIDHDWVESMSGTSPMRPQAVPLYYASLCGFRGLVEHLAVSHPLDVDATGGSHTTALHAVSVKGHSEVARLLLSHGANFNSQDDMGWTALHLASRGGHLAIVESLLEHSADVDSPNTKGQTPLNCASAIGQQGVVRFLLDHGANVNSRDDEGCTPLFEASNYGHTDVVQHILGCGPDVEVGDVEGKTPLYMAARNGHLNVVQLLLEHGANVNAIDVRYLTPLHVSSMAGYLDVVQLLLENGADLKAQDKSFDTPWDRAIGEGQHEVANLLLERSAHACSHSNEDRASLHTASKNGIMDVVRSLVEHGEDVNTRNTKQETPLFLASGNGKLEVTQFLLENGANANSRDENGWGALHFASRKGHLNIVELLLDHGADVDAQAEDGTTPLHHASSKGALEVVLKLIERGATLNVRNRSDWTSLHTAARKRQLEVVRVLVEHGADPDAEAVNGQTPLDVASTHGNIEVAQFLRTHASNIKSADIENWTLLEASKKGRVDVVESLLERGDDVNARNSYGATPLDLASYTGHFNIAQLLLGRGANVKSRDKDGFTPLHSAAQWGHADIAKLLLEHGANINARNKSQCTPLYFASVEGRLEVARVLLQCGANGHLQNDEGMTPFQVAAASGYRDIAQLLSAAQRA